MKKQNLFFLLLMALLLHGTLMAQEQTTWALSDIVDGKFSARGIYGLRPTADGESYTQLSQGGRKIVQCSFRTGDETATLFDIAEAKGPVSLKRIDGYILSPDGRRILLQTQTEQIYRRSFRAQYYIYDTQNKAFAPLSTEGPQQAPQFSPDGTMIAFARNNDLFLVKLLFDNAESRVTTDGSAGKIINGIPDWVYEEEFSTASSFCFSADSKMLCWIRYDESRVPLYNIALYKGAYPTMQENDTYPGTMAYKYPVAGEDNSRVSLHSFDIKSRVSRTLQVPVDSDGYIPRLLPTLAPEKIVVVTLNRHQNKMDLYIVNPRSTIAQLVLREEEQEYVKEEAYTNLTFYADRFVLQSERTGNAQLYLYNLNGQLIRPLTKGDAEVTAFYGYDPQNDRVYYQATDGGPLRRSVFVGDKKSATELTPLPGTNSAMFSGNYRYFIHTYSTIEQAPTITLCDSRGKTIRSLVDNKALTDKVKAEGGTKEFFTFTTSEGVALNGYLIKPRNFNAAQQYPVLMYQYSGPGSQEVKDAWGAGFYSGCVFESYLTQLGYIVACVDGRGTGYRGSAFEKCTYLTLGDKESKDQVEAAIYLGSLPYVDANRIGIWGWSFGGFNTLMAMTDSRAVFKCGVAVAAPTNWKYYDTVYTERYMRTPRENSGYDLNPISRAAQLSGNLLLVHGLADDNVHFRNCAEFSEALVQAGKQFDMQVYTNRNHFIRGGNTRRHLVTRIVDYLKENL